jgi:hypothetical protein
MAWPKIMGESLHKYAAENYSVVSQQTMIFVAQVLNEAFFLKIFNWLGLNKLKVVAT